MGKSRLNLIGRFELKVRYRRTGLVVPPGVAKKRKRINSDH